jgi:hypothetical protein
MLLHRLSQPQNEDAPGDYELLGHLRFAVVLVAILLGLIRAFDWHDATSLRANYWQNPK